MSSDSDKTPKWVIYTGGIASIATIIGVIITILIFVHPGSGPSSPEATPTTVITPTIPPNSSNTQLPNPGNTQTSIQGSPSVDIAGAKSTINTFCEFLNSGATQMAYNLTSSNYQNLVGYNQFLSQFNNLDLINGGCGYNQPTVSGNNVVVSLVMHRVDPSNGVTSSTNYTATLVQGQQSGSWVIDSIQ